MRRVCERLRADLRLDFNFVGGATASIVTAARVRPSSGSFAFRFQYFVGRHRLHFECGARMTVFGLTRVRVLILFGPPPLA